MHWDISSGKTDKYIWPSDEILKSHGMKVREPRNKKHSRESHALAVSSDGRYLATGGVDRHVHIWDVRTREHVQVMINPVFVLWFSICFIISCSQRL